MNRERVLEIAAVAGWRWPDSGLTIEQKLEAFAALIEAEGGPKMQQAKEKQHAEV